ncbi:hypothetical protein TI39_contig408g00004 [Zymoseptoria brevis]|uniref:Uncharacterized protein n=1 Tax=Zymoseptoria brevis TaxID=1047168 RepID=A0A0F4GMA5_9PEZI|nr:hypothetical protein TI39_contig408g00004 [Zymoseptoria brevis]
MKSEQSLRRRRNGHASTPPGTRQPMTRAPQAQEMVPPSNISTPEDDALDVSPAPDSYARDQARTKNPEKRKGKERDENAASRQYTQRSARTSLTIFGNQPATDRANSSANSMVTRPTMFGQDESLTSQPKETNQSSDTQHHETVHHDSCQTEAVNEPKFKEFVHTSPGWQIWVKIIVTLVFGIAAKHFLPDTALDMSVSNSSTPVTEWTISPPTTLLGLISVHDRDSVMDTAELGLYLKTAVTIHQAILFENRRELAQEVHCQQNDELVKMEGIIVELLDKGLREMEIERVRARLLRVTGTLSLRTITVQGRDAELYGNELERGVVEAVNLVVEEYLRSVSRWEVM